HGCEALRVVAGLIGDLHRRRRVPCQGRRRHLEGGDDVHVALVDRELLFGEGEARQLAGRGGQRGGGPAGGKLHLDRRRDQVLVGGLVAVDVPPLVDVQGGRQAHLLAGSVGRAIGLQLDARLLLQGERVRDGRRQ